MSTDSNLENSLLVDYTRVPQLTDLESSVLTEYQNINTNLVKVNQLLKSFTNKNDANNHSIRLIRNLRELETKIPLIYTFFKGAVYSLYAEEDEGIVDDELKSGGDDGDNEEGNERENENDSDDIDEKGTHELSSISDAEGLEPE
ncbi:DAD3 [Candida oxycetoniae]|uniref:DASH complex subunit DAD3 n=1 Tax=Candida oxycetoniae TaxID=497107 RepID=A0AAI9SXP7_9ASCO|nr:DAD3 [Candida oxycetoniae]KAI3405018.2 DAD3 [Candida oxycetoniae]